MDDERRFKVVYYNDDGIGYHTEILNDDDFQRRMPHLGFLLFTNFVDTVTVRSIDDFAMSVEVTTKTRLELSD